MMRSLTSIPLYERVIAQNLITIEWELLQHRRMRDAGLHRIIISRNRTVLFSASDLQRA